MEERSNNVKFKEVFTIAIAFMISFDSELCSRELKKRLTNRTQRKKRAFREDFERKARKIYFLLSCINFILHFGVVIII